jgi:hypothetical protein
MKKRSLQGVEFKKAIVTPLNKRKGESDNFDNYRGISVLLASYPFSNPTIFFPALSTASEKTSRVKRHCLL